MNKIARFSRKRRSKLTHVVILISVIFAVAFVGRLAYVSIAGHRYAHDLCLVYDKPYRTGSTTIERSLCDCWKLKFNATDQELMSPVDRIPLMMNKSDRNVMRCIGHVTITDAQILHMRSDCAKLFYLTSIRPMQQRMASYGKNDAIYGQIYTNMTLSRDQLRNAVLWARKSGRMEEFRYELYPYNEKATLKIVPDYVIRHESFDDDLLRLLHAFDCPQVVQSTNIHSLEVDGAIPENAKPGRTRERSMTNETTNIDNMTFEQLKEQLENIPLHFGDQQHEQMQEIAKSSNVDGLSKAKRLLQIHGVKIPPK